MDKIKLSIDLDDTIANTTDEWIKEASLKLNRKIGKDEIIEYDIDRVLGIDKEYVKAAYAKVWAKANEIKLLDKNIPHIIAELGNLFNIIIVTASPGSEEHIINWLRSNDIYYDSLIKVRHSIDKAELGDRIGIPIFIDDSPKVAKPVLDKGKYMVMIGQPWNAKFIGENTSERLFPASDWVEAESTLKGIANKLRL